jgi:hypothetical protein
MTAALMNEVADHRQVVSENRIQFRSLADLEHETGHFAVHQHALPWRLT